MLESHPIYPDHNATTPLHPEAYQAMERFHLQAFGNPSNSHWAGRTARAGMEQGRRQVAALFGTSPANVLFTAGGSEADNLAIHGVVHARRAQGRHVVSTPLEHPAVLETLRFLAALEVIELSLLGVDNQGQLDLAELAAVLRSDTILVAIMAAHNELGTLYPVTEIARLCKASGAHFHCDGVQAAGKTPLALSDGWDTLAVSAHKLYGPKGIGCLVRRPGVELYPLIRGGGQEQGLRAGTENVPGIVGFGVAAELAGRELSSESARLTALRERLFTGIRELYPQVKRNSPETACLPNTLHVSLPGIDAALLLAEMDRRGVAASAGSACHTGSASTSALVRIGLDADELHGTLRLSLGRGTSARDLEMSLEIIAESLPLAHED